MALLLVVSVLFESEREGKSRVSFVCFPLIPLLVGSGCSLSFRGREAIFLQKPFALGLSRDIMSHLFEMLKIFENQLKKKSKEKKTNYQFGSAFSQDRSLSPNAPSAP